MAEAVGYSKLQDDLNANGYTNLINMILVSDGTYQTSGSQNSSIKVPYLYPSALGRTNLAVVAGVTAPLAFARAVILDKNGNKVETFSLYYSSALSFTRPADYQTVRTKLINAAHASGLYPPYTSVFYPNGGETLLRGYPTNITWDTANLGGNVQIVLYKGGVSNSTVTASVTNSGSYLWNIPAGQTEGTDYRIRVTPLNSPTKFDNSNTNFTIRNAKTTISYPNGGQKFSVNDIVGITWAPDGLIGNVNIELYKGGALYGAIVSGTANDGSHSWTIPANQRIGTDYTIRVTPLSDPTATDVSDAPFAVIPPRQLFYANDMSSNPGWQLGTGWAYGQPTGTNQDLLGNADPTSGYTGNNVIGYNLAGDYEASLTATRWATSAVINCSQYLGVQLKFMRWLGVEDPSYDHAYIDVSSNKTTWSRIWQNTAEVNDNSWTLCQYDISATADGRSNVYVRWGIGTTDSSYNYCGWNIDDVQLLGAPPHTTNWTPYSWLAANGITTNQAANELLDPDQDGLPTWMEYQAGTNPNDSNSVFSVFNVGLISGVNTIMWYGTTNSGVYTDFIIDRCTDLVSQIWVPVGTNSRSATGTNVWQDSNPPASGPRFYRLRLR